MDSANVYHVKHIYLSIQELAPNNNTQTDLIIMDRDKTSDKVPHHELFYTLQYYGQSPTPRTVLHVTILRIWYYKYSKSYRTRTVVLFEESQGAAPVAPGVPKYIYGSSFILGIHK